MVRGMIQPSLERVGLFLPRCPVTQPVDPAAIPDSVAVAPDDIEALNLMVAFQLAEGQVPEAIASLQHLVTLDPTNAEYWHTLAQLWLQTGQLSEAIAALHTAIQLRPEDMTTYETFLQHIATEREFAAVVALAIQGLHRNPVWQRGFLLIGFALQQLDYAPTAVRDCGLGLLSEQVIQDFCPTPFTAIAQTTPSNPALYTLVEPAQVMQWTALPEGTDPALATAFPAAIATEPAYLVTVPQGRIWVDPYTRAVLTDDDRLLADASVGNAALIASSQFLPPPVVEAGAIASLHIRYSYNYFHWMYDALPKVAVLEESGVAWAAIDQILINPCLMPAQRELLALVGIPLEKVIEAPTYHAIADRLLVPVSSFAAGIVPPAVCQFLRQRLLTPSCLAIAPQTPRIYISRAGAKYRTVVNEAAVIAYLATLGFVSVQLETLSAQAQIALFAQAEVIIAPHGAGLANLVFAPAGSTLIELFLPDEVLPYYRAIAQHIGVHYYCGCTDIAPLEAQTVDWDFVGMTAPVSNFVINLDALAALLTQANIR